LTDRRSDFTCGNMSQNSKPDNGKAEREARLAQALRTNLRRRKAAPGGSDKGAAKPESPRSDKDSPADQKAD
jgi:hypothetical protein